MIASPAAAENWPRFRGPTGQGISSETNVPLDVERYGKRRLEAADRRRGVVVADRVGRSRVRHDGDG